MKKRTIIALLGTAQAILMLAVGVALAQSVVDWWVIAGGGGPSTGGGVELNASLGQPIVGPSSGGDVSLRAGYWYGASWLPTAVTLQHFAARRTASPAIVVGAYILIVAAMVAALRWRKQSSGGGRVARRSLPISAVGKLLQDDD
jgi:hypothetical protein